MISGTTRDATKLLVIGRFFLFLLAAEMAFPNPTVRHFRWNVESIFWSPDCIENSVMAINGKFPGPTIRAKAGDTVVVRLTNKLNTEGVVIHWHGIGQRGTPWMDGTASISQCPINPGETFIYTFVVDKPGTYFYHGHYGMQRSAGLYGSLIVEAAAAEPFQYDVEFNILMSDWWHRSVHEQEIGLSSVPFRWINEPDSLLINGRGQYNCSLAAGTCKFEGAEQCAPYILTVHPNKTYRLRLASTTALASLNVAVENHKMVVVEADGNYVEPFEVDDLYIYSGESYSVLIKTDQDPTKNYWISAGVIGRKPNTTQALTLLNYVSVHAGHLPGSPPPAVPRWDDYVRMKSFAQKLRSISRNSAALSPPPARPHRRIALLNTQNLFLGQIKWAINNISLSLPPTPYLGSIRYKLRAAFDPSPPPESFPDGYDITVPAANRNCTVGNGVYMLGFNTTVDVVLQNANALAANTSEVHPWHLHGHNFWVVGYGDGRFVEGLSEKGFNVKDPPVRNTAVVFPYGWTAVRFVADNPGAWAFHCHLEPHLHMGMGVVLAEGVDRLRQIPAGALRCGLMGDMSANRTVGG
ncbi:hypothetical protein SAY86_018308 [Trapa natans]|uniref:L-ascorbate oxidase n=1 Tax=Trapa natans TaxID=22666 RepID=A0AAN7LMS4_TRANT|nr:hypothetical protein SAY86_018308 [Trapa natans]